MDYLEDWNKCLRELDKAAESIAKLRETLMKVSCSAEEAQESLERLKEET